MGKLHRQKRYLCLWLQDAPPPVIKPVGLEVVAHGNRRAGSARFIATAQDDVPRSFDFVECLHDRHVPAYE